ncbi:hypothetical protein QF032_004433 [Streptomyces achromogenes]|uniref:hypothetical protein n=1 Tax=Streptomyces achromogenes TaxID=67255 RepID=UPI00277E31D0|nr:hypothetical protein [Streptomyces achromogenes]MDQ0832589.1 hypothetical protein [Streptomyces achromogenes]
MPRGRHRHSPPLHRLLPPSVIAGVSLVCALGPWVFTQQTTLRGLAAAAAVTAIVGAVVMRRWDMQAGKHVADLTRARASDEWRYEERVAELESDLDESRELRVKLEQRLRAKRAELAGLRNEHAALLRRYATAETERASALEGRRLLEIEAVPALPGPPASEPTADSAVEVRDAVEGPDAAEGAESAEAAESVESAVAESGEPRADVPQFSAVFSPEGSKLFLRAQAALARLDTDGVESAKDQDLAAAPSGEEPARAASAEAGAADGHADGAREDEAQGKPEAVDEHARATAPHPAADDETPPGVEASRDDRTSQGVEASHDAVPETEGPQEDTAPEIATENEHPGALADAPEAVRSRGESDAARTAPQPEPPLDPEPGAAPAPTATTATTPAAVEAAAGAAGALLPRPAAPVRPPSGHFAVPTAVAVVPTAQPVRRPTAEGGFDFFGTKSESTPDALEAVQNEDLADVVGQEALALHKAESEAEFKPAGEASRGVGQVIDLTAHDETEQIDLQQLRSAVS